MAVTDPDVPVYQGTSMFLVPTDTPGIEIIRNVGLGGERAGRGLARVRALQPGPRARRQPARRRGSGVRDRADAARRWPHPPRDAHHRRRASEAFDMMCERALSRVDAGRGAREEADGAGEDRRLLHPARAVPAAGAPRGVEDRPGRWRTRRAREIAVVKVLTPKVLHDIVYRGAAHPRLARHVERDAAHRDVVDDAGHGHRRRSDRGAQGDDRPPGAEGVLSRRRASSRARTCRRGRRRPASGSPTCSSTKSHSTDTTTL